jgi:membrane protease YdiL (CAAX protease family)
MSGAEPPRRPTRPDVPAGRAPWAWPRATWRAIEAVPVFLAAVVAAGILAAPVAGAMQSDGGAYVWTALCGEITLLASVLFTIRVVHRTSLAALGTGRKPWLDALIGVGVGLLLVPVSEYSLALIRWAAEALGHPLSDPQQIPTGVVGTALALFGFVAILAAPLAEESFFRGFLFQGLRRRYGVLASALVSSALFGLAHYVGPSSAQLLVPLGIVGFGLALVYERRQSLLASICAHAVFNVFGYLSLLRVR